MENQTHRYSECDQLIQVWDRNHHILTKCNTNTAVTWCYLNIGQTVLPAKSMQPTSFDRHSRPKYSSLTRGLTYNWHGDLRTLCPMYCVYIVPRHILTIQHFGPELCTLHMFLYTKAGSSKEHVVCTLYYGIVIYYDIQKRNEPIGFELSIFTSLTVYVVRRHYYCFSYNIQCL